MTRTDGFRGVGMTTHVEECGLLGQDAGDSHGRIQGQRHLHKVGEVGLQHLSVLQQRLQLLNLQTTRNTQSDHT